jgi:hypothetical protein
MAPVPPKKKTTPEQRFVQFYRVYWDNAATENEKTTAKRNMDAWLKRHGRTEKDYPAIFAKGAKDDEAANPPPPPSDPRDAAPHPYEDP